MSHISPCYEYVDRREDEISFEYGQRVANELEAEILRLGPETVMAFMAEPVVGATLGAVPAVEGYFARIREICDQYGVLLILDEVMCGMGRTGHLFACDHYQVAPDILCIAKGLGAGYQPIGALLFSDAVWETLAAQPRWYTSGFTYSGHPVACAAALKNIDILEREGLCGRALEIGAIFQEGLMTLAGLPLVGDVRGEALIGCVENVADKETLALLPDEIDIGRRISDAAQAKGLLVRPLGHLNVMSPALTISEAQVQFTVDTLGLAIREVADDLTRSGLRLT